jgi:Cytosol aminopeptidase family, N-terminal domain
MKTWARAMIGAAIVSAHCGPAQGDDPANAKQTRVAATGGTKVTIRMQGPYDAEVPLQIVCYFKHKESGDKTFGAAVALDEKLGGLIGSLRARGEFRGDELETLLIDVPAGTIKPKRLLLIGLGDESSLSLDRMEQVGRVALREGVKLGATKMAFAPLIRDQGNDKIGTGNVATAVVQGVLLAYDTERRLQKQGFAKPYTLEEWVEEAGPAYYDETIAGVKKAVAQARDSVEAREPKPYSTKSK